MSVSNTSIPYCSSKPKHKFTIKNVGQAHIPKPRFCQIKELGPYNDGRDRKEMSSKHVASTLDEMNSDAIKYKHPAWARDYYRKKGVWPNGNLISPSATPTNLDVTAADTDYL